MSKKFEIRISYDIIRNSKIQSSQCEKNVHVLKKIWIILSFYWWYGSNKDFRFWNVSLEGNFFKNWACTFMWRLHYTVLVCQKAKHVFFLHILGFRPVFITFNIRDRGCYVQQRLAQDSLCTTTPNKKWNEILAGHADGRESYVH